MGTSPAQCVERFSHRSAGHRGVAVGHEDLQAYLERASRGTAASSGQWQGWDVLDFDGATTHFGYEETAGVDASGEGEVRAPQGDQETPQVLRLRRVFAGGGDGGGSGVVVCMLVLLLMLLCLFLLLLVLLMLMLLCSFLLVLVVLMVLLCLCFAVVGIAVVGVAMDVAVVVFGAPL